MVPVTGPAPQMELNWCEKTVKHEAGEKFLPSLHAARRREGLRVDAPRAREPAPVEQVPGDQHHGRNEHDDDSVHVSSL